jgi:lysozyme
MTLHHRLPRSAVELVMLFEGLRRKAARLSDGRWTVGYGHTASARQGVEISQADAEALLLYDLSRTALAVEDAVLSPLDDNQFAALVAFAFNIGVERFRRSEVLKRVNEGAFLQAATAIERWRRSDFDGDSIVVDALVRRRAAEKLLFLTPSEGFRPVPTPIVPPEFDASPLEDAVEVDAPLEGDAEARLISTEPAEDPPTAAARRVIDRLNAILADDALVPAADEMRARDPQPAPAAPPEVETAPPPLSPPPIQRSALHDLSTTFELERRSARVIEDLDQASLENEDEDDGRPIAPIVLAIGVFGLTLFVAALATIVCGQATWANLSLGVVGVIAMAPLALRLIGRAADGR